ncbi:hypothetical protein EGI16_21400 [Chryseobacterium sp. G0240]|uniref:hypothetical protein n=1 Tax=Chryseobacterium sp. G0240 TaxID=2487066 RepID=UPI000F4502D0|nr:hypothetical protein [Chryseobacterium sp. G0240]ROH98394.1 hypothetical protein EGI16_21400 [Chryseobacterium sp. G0240]
MKKLFLFFILVSCSLFGQECKCEPEFIKTINEMSKEQILHFSDEIISGFEKKQKYIKTISQEPNLIKIIYYENGIPDNIIATDLKDGYCSLCTELIFKKYYKGKNSDLNIIGQEFFSFVSAEGKYLDLYKWWQKKFYPNLSKEEILNNSKTHYIKLPDIRLDLRFVKNLDTWEIQNKF